MSCLIHSCHVISWHVIPIIPFIPFIPFIQFISFIHSFIQWFNQKSVHWFIEAFIASFIQYCKSLIHELIHFLVNSLIHLLFQWLIDLFTHSFIKSLIPWFIYSFLFIPRLPYSLFWQPFAHSFDAPRNPNLSLILHPTDILLETRLFFETSAKALPRSTWYSYIILSLYNIARANVRAYA